MDILPVAPLQVSVSSASQHIAEKLYLIVDAAIADVSTSVCELLKEHVVVSSLTERDRGSAMRGISGTRMCSFEISGRNKH